MKTLFLLLAITGVFTSDPVFGKKVSVQQTENTEITVQSVSDGNEYRLLLEITSLTWQFQSPKCDASLMVDNEPLSLSCFVIRSVERISGNGSRNVIVEHLSISGDEKLQAAVKASSVILKVGLFEFQLNEDELKHLRPVRSEP